MIEKSEKNHLRFFQIGFFAGAMEGLLLPELTSVFQKETRAKVSSRNHVPFMYDFILVVNITFSELDGLTEKKLSILPCVAVVFDFIIFFTPFLILSSLKCKI